MEQQPHPAPPGPSVDDPTGPVILVVDDDDAVGKVAARVLQRVGYRCCRRERESRPSRSRARTHAGRLDLLLTDVVIPGMNGRELGERLAVERPETRLLYMSAYTEDEVILRGVRVAEVGFLYKPFSLDGLTDAVRQALSA